MNDHYRIRLTLCSDATFGRGDGVAGLVDQEIEHDQFGLPFLRGRTLKGLLCDECANILYALDHMPNRTPEHNAPWRRAARDLFGEPGSAIQSSACFTYGDAQLPAALRSAVEHAVMAESLQPPDILASLTAIRRQTSMDEYGVPERASLRAMRVILRETVLDARIEQRRLPDSDPLPLLAACVRGLRRAGTGRNRGRGRLRVELLQGDGTPFDADPYQCFVADLAPVAATETEEA